MNSIIKLTFLVVFLQSSFVIGQGSLKYYKSYQTQCGDIPNAELMNPFCLKGKQELSASDTLQKFYEIALDKDNKIRSFNLHNYCENSFKKCYMKCNYLLSKSGTYSKGIIDWGSYKDSVTYLCDDKGRIIKTYFTNGHYIFDYDEKDNLIKVSQYDKEDNLIEGYATIKYNYDISGNQIERKLYDRNNVLYCDIVTDGKIIKKYDSFGRIIEENYFKTDVVLSDGFSKITYEYDSNGNIITQCFFDNSNNLSKKINSTYFDHFQINTTKNYFYLNGELSLMTRSVFSEDGKLMEESNFDKNGDLVEVYSVNVNGYSAILRNKYGNQGNSMESFWFGKNDSLIDGVAITQQIFDNRGNCIELKTLDKDRNLIEVDGFAIVRSKFDSKDNLVEIAYYNEYDSLIHGALAVQRWKYDLKGNCIEIKDFDRFLNLFENALGCAITRYKYDSNGNRIVTTWTNKSDQFIEGVAIEECKYDELNNCVEIKNLDKSRHLVEDLTLNCAVTRYKYNSRGNVIESSWYDKNDSLREGVAIERSEYDSRGNFVKQAKYSRKGQLVPIHEGTSVAVQQYKYDSEGRLIEESYLDTNGRFTLVTDADYMSTWTYQLGPYSIVKFSYDTAFSARVYDEMEVLKKIVLFDKPNSLYPKQITYYNGENNLSANNGLDVDNLVCRYVYNYNSSNIKIREISYDKNLDFLQRIDYAYDGFNMVGISYFNEQGKPELGPEGYFKLDPLNNIYYDVKGKVMKIGNFSDSKVSYLMTYGYDQNGSIIYEKYFSKKGKPINCEQGYHHFNHLNLRYYNIKGEEVFYNVESGKYQ